LRRSRKFGNFPPRREAPYTEDCPRAKGYPLCRGYILARRDNAQRVIRVNLRNLWTLLIVCVIRGQGLKAEIGEMKKLTYPEKAHGLAPTASSAKSLACAPKPVVFNLDTEVSGLDS
jgi:hypothetical protein